jgi:hypothetical protein
VPMLTPAGVTVATVATAIGASSSRPDEGHNQGSLTIGASPGLTRDTIKGH